MLAWIVAHTEAAALIGCFLGGLALGALAVALLRGSLRAWIAELWSGDNTKVDAVNVWQGVGLLGFLGLEAYATFKGQILGNWGVATGIGLLIAGGGGAQALRNLRIGLQPQQPPAPPDPNNGG